MTTLSRVHALATRAHRRRVEVDLAEGDLLRCVQEYLADNRGGVREIARKMEFSPAYISDVQHGRRKISATFIERLCKL